MSTTTLAIVVPNLVAGIALWLNRLQTRDALRSQRRLVDVADLRGLLDETALALHKSEYALNSVRIQLTQRGQAFFDGDLGEQILEEVTTAGERCDTLSARLTVLLGRGHGVTLAFDIANTAQLEIFRRLGMIRMLTTDDLVERRMPDERAEFRARQDEISKLRDDFDSGREEFLDLAQKEAGVQSSPEPRRLAWRGAG